MSWTSAFGQRQRVAAAEDRGTALRLTRISPNALTFIGLLINIVAAVFFGFARGDHAVRYFVYAGLVIIGAGIFDMVDGRVARQTQQVSIFRRILRFGDGPVL